MKLVVSKTSCCKVHTNPVQRNDRELMGIGLISSDFSNQEEAC